MLSQCLHSHPVAEGAFKELAEGICMVAAAWEQIIIEGIISQAYIISFCLPCRYLLPC